MLWRGRVTEHRARWEEPRGKQWVEGGEVTKGGKWRSLGSGQDQVESGGGPVLGSC